MSGVRRSQTGATASLLLVQFQHPLHERHHAVVPRFPLRSCWVGLAFSTDQCLQLWICAQ
jgi:hypothetical protein